LSIFGWLYQIEATGQIITPCISSETLTQDSESDRRSYPKKELILSGSFNPLHQVPISFKSHRLFLDISPSYLIRSIHNLNVKISSSMLSQGSL
jgi:hypothetical protein